MHEWKQHLLDPGTSTVLESCWRCGTFRTSDGGMPQDGYEYFAPGVQPRLDRGHPVGVPDEPECDERHTLPTGQVLTHGTVTHWGLKNLSNLREPVSAYAEVSFDGRSENLSLEVTQKVYSEMTNHDSKGYMRVVVVLLPRGNMPIWPRDRDWSAALAKEFDIGGAIRVEDDKWVREKKTLPERWARIVRLATTPPGVKLHDYPPPSPIKLDPEEP